jgi:hypothetical protein
MSKRFTSSVHTGHTKIVESFLEETFGAFLTRKYEKSAKPRLKIRENILLVLGHHSLFKNACQNWILEKRSKLLNPPVQGTS